jgi:transglutaminase-like putative cysteine protease
MGLPAGPGAVPKTLAIMAKLARGAVRSPTQYARAKAIEIFRDNHVPARAYALEARTLQAFVQNTIRYVRDPDGLELVQTPEVTLKTRTGDCDDQSTLLAALLVATGHQARFVAVGIGGEPLSHVLVETKVGDQWIPAETILKKPFGWYPPNVTSRLVRDV